jgi:hypothetical protein
VTSGDDPRDADFEQASSQLNEGLKNCRSMLNDYRVMLTGKGQNDNEEPGGGDIGRSVSAFDSKSESDDGGRDEERADP